MSLLKSLNRKMERDQVASRALMGELDKTSITDMDNFREELWSSIATSQSNEYTLDILNNEQTPFDFIVRVLIKIGFSCEDAVRLMMTLHRNGHVFIASAEEPKLIQLQDYLYRQASRHACLLKSRIIKND